MLEFELDRPPGLRSTSSSKQEISTVVGSLAVDTESLYAVGAFALNEEAITVNKHEAKATNHHPIKSMG